MQSLRTAQHKLKRISLWNLRSSSNIAGKDTSTSSSGLDSLGKANILIYYLNFNDLTHILLKFVQ